MASARPTSETNLAKTAGRRSWWLLLGLGLGLFEFLMALQFLGIYLFGPAMMSRVITSEKERNSLGLLLLTDHLRQGLWPTDSRRSDSAKGLARRPALRPPAFRRGAASGLRPQHG